MPAYEIEQYELHTLKYRVEAANEAEAIKKLFDGWAEPVDNSLDFVGICEDVGLAVEEHRTLVDNLTALGVSVGDCVIPSICGITIVD